MRGWDDWRKLGIHMKPCYVCHHKIWPWQEWMWRDMKIGTHSVHLKCVRKI